jgi:holliday junction DNA helicase RuvA
MIAFLTGKVTEQLDDMIGLDVGGVGYGLWVPMDDWGHLTVGVTVRVYVYEHIREQAHDLFGFVALTTKKLFEQLLSVNGVGPKMALAVLNVGPADEVKLAIAEGNIKYLLAASGVGRKVAERIVVDLKDKVGLGNNPNATTFLGTSSVNRNDEALEALVSLGYSAQDAANALAGIDAKLTAEERIKLALKGKR